MIYVIARGVFTSTKDLDKKLMRYISFDQTANFKLHVVCHAELPTLRQRRHGGVVPFIGVLLVAFHRVRNRRSDDANVLADFRAAYVFPSNKA